MGEAHSNRGHASKHLSGFGASYTLRQRLPALAQHRVHSMKQKFVGQSLIFDDVLSSHLAIGERGDPVIRQENCVRK